MYVYVHVYLCCVVLCCVVLCCVVLCCVVLCCVLCCFARTRQMVNLERPWERLPAVLTCKPFNKLRQRGERLIHPSYRIIPSRVSLRKAGDQQCNQVTRLDQRGMENVLFSQLSNLKWAGLSGYFRRTSGARANPVFSFSHSSSPASIPPLPLPLDPTLPCVHSKTSPCVVATRPHAFSVPHSNTPHHSTTEHNTEHATLKQREEKKR